MTSSEMRSNPLFMRNLFKTSGSSELSLVKKQKVSLEDARLIAYSDVKRNDKPENTTCGVHFFIDDDRFFGVYNNPKRSFARLSQYAFLLSPDYSTYAEMDPWRQLVSVAHNRWVGAYWQSRGLLVIPTISWGGAKSYSFCFDGVERGSAVAVGMIDCKRSKTAFLRGYDAMLEAIEPETVLVFGAPFPEMKGNLVVVDYRASRKGAR